MYARRGVTSPTTLSSSKSLTFPNNKTLYPCLVYSSNSLTIWCSIDNTNSGAPITNVCSKI